MIYPRLNQVRNGQRLSVELVNGLIKRTEYAGDLLRQGKCLAGTDISIAQRYDGTTISGAGGKAGIRVCGLQSRASTSQPPIAFFYDGENYETFEPSGTSVESYALDVSKNNVCGGYVFGGDRFGYIFDLSSKTFIYPLPNQYEPGEQTQDTETTGAHNEKFVGWYNDIFYGYIGYIYENGSIIRIQYPLPANQKPSSYADENNTIFNGIHNNIIVGSVGLPATKGLVLNIDTGAYTVVNAPSGYTGLEFYGVYNQIICGRATRTTGFDAVIYENGLFSIISSFESFYKINSQYVTFNNKNLYDYKINELFEVEISQDASLPKIISGIDKQD